MKIFKDKRFRYGTFSTVMVLFAVVIFVLANLLAGEFDRNIDLTAQQIFTLTEQSRDFVEGLDRDVTLTLIAGVGQELPGGLAEMSRIISHLLTEYDAASSYIRIEQRDPLLNPALIHRFAADAGIEGGISSHSVVVESADAIRVVQSYEMVDFDINPFTGQIMRITSYNIEREITRAIHHVSMGAATVVYYVTGSGEDPLPPQFVEFLEAENFEVREVNLVLHDVPEDADILFIPMPERTRDWTETKASRILTFLEDEGRAFFALDHALAETPNLANVLDDYGLSLTGYFIFEGDERHILPGRFDYIIPNLVRHPITESLFVRGFNNIAPFLSAEMQINSVRRTTLDIEPLWMTTDSAFVRSPYSEAASFARFPTDVGGQFPLAIAVTDRIFLDGTAYYTRIVAVNGLIYSPWYNAYIGEGNWHFVLNSLQWMKDQPPSIWVPGRVPPGQMPLLITGSEANIIGGIAMGGLPIVFLGVGAFVWLRRRHN
ncbi:MAG: GldG family protein [Defluviitaleaceae bacterium]|nr:GldG family protein [Defluviitaleaceae bacterium]